MRAGGGRSGGAAAGVVRGAGGAARRARDQMGKRDKSGKTRHGPRHGLGNGPGKKNGHGTRMGLADDAKARVAAVGGPGRASAPRPAVLRGAARAGSARRARGNAA